MARTKRVLFVSAEHHGQVVGELRAKNNALEKALDDIGSLTDHMLEHLTRIARESKRNRKWRKKIVVDKYKALLGCGREGCHRLMIVSIDDLPARMEARACPECKKDDRRAFRKAAFEINLSASTPK